ncbi:hypothetical protein Leryth_013472 [Lithospermum erythrorhizon]|nr:hypothetical protein Leryth_013472 [Lithospermum erythrorhizon]
MGCRGANFKTSSSRFKKEENINKEKLKATEDRCSPSEENSRSSVDANEETESLVSSHPSSNSSTDKTSIGHEIGRENVNSGKLKHCYSSNKTGLEQVIPCPEDGKVDESYAVMKRSKSPTDDFKKSMMEMIVEKQMFGVDELERLLSCFLSLNSRQHHAAIVSAFTEVWMALFSQTGWPPEC